MCFSPNIVNLIYQWNCSIYKWMRQFTKINKTADSKLEAGINDKEKGKQDRMHLGVTLT